MNSAFVVSDVLLWIIVTFNLVLTIALVRGLNKLRANSSSQANSQGFEQPDPLPVGERAPDFVAETVTGQKMTLSDYLGRTVAFIFTMSNCQPCKDKVAALQELASKAHRAGVEFVLVNVEDMTTTQN